jgi:hypothetical protein
VRTPRSRPTPPSILGAAASIQAWKVCWAKRHAWTSCRFMAPDAARLSCWQPRQAALTAWWYPAQSAVKGARALSSSADCSLQSTPLGPGRSGPQPKGGWSSVQTWQISSKKSPRGARSGGRKHLEHRPSQRGTEYPEGQQRGSGRVHSDGSLMMRRTIAPSASRNLANTMPALHCGRRNPPEIFAARREKRFGTSFASPGHLLHSWADDDDDSQTPSPIAHCDDQ